MLQNQGTNGTSQSKNTKKFSFSGTLNSLGKIDRLPACRFRWNTNEEVFTILTSLEQHKNWAASDVAIRPPNGSQLLYNRNNLKTRSYHNDKYFWKTRKNSKSSARVDHSSLRIRGIECIYCSYVHSALVPTFHRRCYWLLENPDIVLVHYLNIPDKTTTFDDIVTSLLPYKHLAEQELLCQLQPILTSSEGEGSSNMIIPVDVSKLITEVKNYKEPKTKRRSNQKKASANSKQGASSTSRKQSERVTTKNSHTLDKCSNCNRYYTSNGATAATSSRTNVAVTINRQTTSATSTKPSVSDASSHTPINFTAASTRSNTQGQVLVTASPVVQNVMEQNFGSVQHRTNQGLLPSDLRHSTTDEDRLSTNLGQTHSNQLYICHGLVNESSYSIGTQDHLEHAVTSQENHCMLENDHVVLDYDGINLVQSQSENDFSKEFDINLFENDLFDLPGYLPDLQPNLQNSPEVMLTAVPSMTRKGPEITRVTLQSNFGAETPRSNSLPNYPHYFSLVQSTSTGSAPGVARTSCSPSDMISTDCHTLSNLTPSLLYGTRTADDVVPVGHQCPSKEQVLDPDKERRENVLQIGVSEERLSSVAHVDGIQESGTQIDASQFVVPRVDVSGTANVTVAHNSVCVSTMCFLQSQLSFSESSVTSQGLPNVGLSQSLVGTRLSHVSCAETNQCHPHVVFTRINDSRMAQKNDSQNGLNSQLSWSRMGLPQLSGSSAKITQDVSGVGVSGNVSTNATTSHAPTQSITELQTSGNHLGDVITEFSPEWSYCDGKTKILILGDWSRTYGPYSCLFDGCSVPAILIQPGVLRCFCPPHDPGLVALQVAWNGFIISNACVFEYKTRENSTNSVADWLGSSDTDLKKLILERLERLEGLLGISVSSVVTDCEVGTIEGEAEAVENRLVRICEVFLGEAEACAFLDAETRPEGLTLLHLAAGLGYTKLIRLLQSHAEKMRVTGRDDVLDVTETDEQSSEWSPYAKDSFGCTPLMWACWRGHHNTAMMLLSWKPSSYSSCDHSGRSAKTIAQEMGHMALVHAMEEFMRGEDMYSLVMESSPQSPGSSCAYLSASSNEQVPQSPMSGLSADSLKWERVDGICESSTDFEMASVIPEDRPNTLGKVLVEIRTLIQQAEERAMSPLQTPSNSAPFSLGFTGLPDIPCDEGPSENVMTSDSDLGPRTTHYDTLSVDSSPIRTPSSHSPGSPAIRGSPQSTRTDTSEFEEFLSKPRQFLERDFSELTLTDIEQQELLQAAKIIQNAYRQFKIRKKQHVDELKAAVLIQSYYRRYKQFALYKRITKAAVLIQNSYRAHKEHKQFKRSRHAAAVIQTYFRHYRKRKQRHAEEDAPAGKRLETKYRKPSYGK